jgi:uncharacterized coiled-coil DUF342 family protein
MSESCPNNDGETKQQEDIMSRVYESLKKGIQGTLQHDKVIPINKARPGSTKLNDTMERFEKLFGEGIGTLKACIQEAETVATEETQNAEKIIENLNGSIAELDARIKETEDTARKKDLATQRKEENLVSKIHELQGEVKKKTEVLESRGTEINHLKTEIQAQAKRIIQLESAIDQVKEDAAKNALLEAQLRDLEEMAHKKEEDFTARIHDMERKLTHKENFLAVKDTQLKDLHSQLKNMTNGIREMSSFFKQAEVFAGIETKEGGGILPAAELESGYDKAVPSRPNLTDAFQKPYHTVSTAFFERITAELVQLIGPMASILVHDHVEALGESTERFPKARVAELLELISGEVEDERQKIDFRQRLAKSI